MSIWQEFFSDPVIFFTFTGLAILVGMSVFFTIFFFVKAAKNDA